MSLFLAIVCLGLLALLTEVACLVCRPFLERYYRESEWRASLQAAQGDLAEAKRRVDTISPAAKAVRQELARAKETLVDLERQFEEKKKTKPVVVLPAGHAVAGGTRSCFRAPVSKTLGADAEPQQAHLWRQVCFVEVWADSRAEATVEAHLQFPGGQGYRIGSFSVADKTESSAASAEREPQVA